MSVVNAIATVNPTIGLDTKIEMYVLLVDFMVDFITQSRILTIGAIFLIGAIVLSVLNGLIDIAFYVLLFGGIALFFFGIMNSGLPGSVQTHWTFQSLFMQIVVENVSNIASWHFDAMLFDIHDTLERVYAEESITEVLRTLGPVIPQPA